MTHKLSQKHATILGVRLDSTSISTVLRQVQANVQNKKKIFITTPNPEIVMNAQDDKQLREILNLADISIPDGVGLIAAEKFISLPRPKTFISRMLVLFAQGLGVGFSILFDKEWLESEIQLIKGREVFNELIKIANKKEWKVVLIGDRKGSAQKAVKILKASHLNLQITALEGPNLDKTAKVRTAADKTLENKAIEKINKVKPELLFVGFGSPRQEKWLYRWLTKLNCNAAMVVGGTFDYVAETKQLPPEWIEDMNLEWLWRLIKGDQKMQRVTKAFPRFVWKIYWQKLLKK